MKACSFSIPRNLLILIMSYLACPAIVLAGTEPLQATMISKAAEKGMLPVIIRLKTSGNKSVSSSTSQLSQKESIKASRKNFLKRLNKFSPARVKEFQHTGLTSMVLDSAGLKAALADPDVADVFEDRLVKSSLLETTSLIGSETVSSTGVDGTNQVVAVLDTGVDSSHPFLASKVVDEACFSKTTSDATSACPNGSNSQTGPGAAVPCSIGGCNHGTHVAGIVAGKGSSFSGVASEAGIMAVQVFSEFSASACGGSPCVQAYTSDLISGLEYVYSQRENFNIAAVNMSLGGGSYSAACDDEPIKDAIDLLKSVDIATVIASGNNGFVGSISFPACVSSAISVGATTKSDDIASYSNTAEMLDLLAPGSSIQSSVPGTGYAYMSGTSMATPHVAGAFALLRSQNPSESVDVLLETLQATGAGITDTRNTLSRSRIQLDQAVEALAASSNKNKHDFDNDGRSDIFWRHSSTGLNWMFNMNGSSIAGSSSVNKVADQNWQIAGVGDMDGDGDADILWRHAVTGLNWIYLMNGSDIQQSLRLNTVPDLNWKIAAFEDFNGDGISDIFWRNHQTGLNWLFLIKNASVNSSVPINTVPDMSWVVAGVADFNNDNQADILWRNSVSGANWIFMMNGAQVASSVPLDTISNLNWQVESLGDRNGDGNADILWRDQANGTVWSYLMDGNIVISSEPLLVVGSQWQISQASDFDGDGKEDLLWRHQTSGSNWIHTMDGNSIVKNNSFGAVSSSWNVIGQ